MWASLLFFFGTRESRKFAVLLIFPVTERIDVCDNEQKFFSWSVELKFLTEEGVTMIVINMMSGFVEDTPDVLGKVTKIRTCDQSLLNVCVTLLSSNSHPGQR